MARGPGPERPAPCPLTFYPTVADAAPLPFRPGTWAEPYLDRIYRERVKGRGGLAILSNWGAKEFLDWLAPRIAGEGYVVTRAEWYGTLSLVILERSGWRATGARASLRHPPGDEDRRDAILVRETEAVVPP